MIRGAAALWKLDMRGALAGLADIEGSPMRLGGNTEALDMLGTPGCRMVGTPGCRMVGTPGCRMVGAVALWKLLVPTSRVPGIKWGVATLVLDMKGSLTRFPGKRGGLVMGK